ncbi:MAG: hypothetical protein WCG36_07420, partial [bacterium]
MSPSRPLSLRGVILPLLRPYRWWLAGAVALQVIHGAALSIQTLTPKWLIDDILNRRDIAPERQWMLFAGLAAIYLVLSLVCRMLFWHLSYRLFTTVRERTVLALRAQFFRHVNH